MLNVLTKPAHNGLAYLDSIGWLDSARTKRPVDGEGNPVPWYTYACRNFLAERIMPEFHVFEFGSGHSTLWWAKRAASVTSVEHNKAFVDEISQDAPENVTYLHRDDPEAYVATLAEQPRSFDVVIVDGIVRVDCCRVAVDGLTDRGIVIVDNADNMQRRAGYQALVQRGFRRLDFISHGPIWSREWSTAIFYRPDNCVGI